jgi:predicted metal-dependent hydrolase
MDANVERSAIRFGHTVIPYVIERGRRLKTVAIGVDPVNGVCVRAPGATPIARLDIIVHRKARWIMERLRRHEDLPPPPSPREFVSGETFRYLGRQYRLKLEPSSDANVRVRITKGRLIVPVPKKGSTPADARDRLVAWFRDRAAIRVPERVAAWSAKLGLHPSSVLIREPRKRWGSADARGNIRLNWRIIQTPTRLIDYVVAHELVHLAYPDHTRDFWAALGQAMPDYEGRREALRRLGRQVVW